MKSLAIFCLFAAAAFASAFAKTNTVATATADVMRLRYAASAEGRAFDITGVVLMGEDVFQFLDDGSGPTFVTISKIPPARRPRRGDLARFRGHLRRDDYSQNNPIAETAEILGRRPLPTATPLRDLDLSKHLYGHVSVSGVVVSVRSDELDNRYNWLILKSPAGTIQAAALSSRHALRDLQTALDADVSLTGFVLPQAGWRRNLGAFLFLDDQNAVQVLCPALDNPFFAPALTDVSVLHRQSTTGIVVVATADRFYLSNDDHMFLPVRPAEGVRIPRTGSRVHVAGFTETDPFNLQIVNALVRVESTGTPILEPARPIKPTQLFSNASGHPTELNGHGKVDPALHGKILRVRGVVRYFPGEPEKTGTIDLVCDGHTIKIDVSTISAGFEGRFPSDSLLDVSGLCLAEFDTPISPAHFPTFSRFTLIPRAIDDLVLVRRASWWTPRRLKNLVAYLVALIAVFLVWTISLQRLSERRGRALAQEKHRASEARVKVEERTRLAVELHDSISQTLTGVALQVDSAVSSNAGQNAAVERFLTTSRQMLASCRKELQSCLWDLRSRTFEEKDMNEAVLRSVKPYVRDISLSVRFNVPRDSLSETTTHVILKAVRELVVNAVRHGRARNVRIAGEYHEGTVRFSVADDGVGFDVATAEGPSEGHFGLQGIRERIRPMHGTLAISSSRGGGTRVTVSLDAIEKNEHES